MNGKVTLKIKVWGIVQGVGFRPFAAKLANRIGLGGEVLNTGGLVEITVTGESADAEEFIAALRREKPAPAKIIHIDKEYTVYREFDGFTIADSACGEDETVMIPADLSICQSCLDEMNDEKNERYQHPFISCMECGPRYTIIDRLPYDRANTSMADFEMCRFCEGQYADGDDRRYHAQTISCHECGPVIAYRHFDGKNIDADSKYMIHLAAKLIGEGRVIAVKGVGGYNLICDPAREAAVRTLREVKRREQKPFAVMFRDTRQAKEYCEISETEEKLLESPAKPILLLERKERENKDREWKKPEDEARGNSASSAYPAEFEQSRFIGAFLPGMGLHYLLIKACGRPLIVTSANISGLPMIKDDEKMFGLAAGSGGAVAGTFFNGRKIRVAADDSVMRVIDGKPQMIRRSKGYVPVPLHVRPYGGILEKNAEMLACGGQLKSAFALSKGSFSYVSQYFGDLDSAESMDIYEENVGRMKAFFGIEPAAVICDMHPLYETTKYAERYAERSGAELIRVQHHHAHVASVMAEHGITGPVIGVSFDGTGYGVDGKVWGGEFLICEGSRFRRDAHLKYVTMVGGDSQVKDAWKCAMCYVHARELEKMKNGGHSILGKVAARGRGELQVDAHITAGNMTERELEGMKIDAHSIFGNVTARGLEETRVDTDIIAGNKNERELGADEITVDISEFIAESDIREDANWPIIKAALENKVNTVESSSMGRLFDAVSALLGICRVNRYEGECAILLEDAAARALAGRSADRRDRLALKFHELIADMIFKRCVEIREREGLGKAALTGGVFQNRILMEKTLELLRGAGFEVYYNISVSPNDGGIALGQNYIGMCRSMEKI